jgi:hypothetical protein
MHITKLKPVIVVLIPRNNREWRQGNIKMNLKEGLLWAAFFLHKLV